MLIHTHVHTLTDSLTHTHTYTDSHTHTHRLTHTYTHRLTHTHTHTHRLTHTDLACLLPNVFPHSQHMNGLVAACIVMWEV